MATSGSLETENKSSWLMRTFSSKNSRSLESSSSPITNHTNSFSNHSFTSFSDVLKSKPTTNQQPKQQQQSSLEESLVDIAVNAASDTSSLADRSRGTIDFFHTPSVSSILNELFHKFKITFFCNRLQ